MDVKPTQMSDKTHVKARLTHCQKDAFELAMERYQEAQGRPCSQEEVIRSQIARFCVDQGVRFTLTKRRKRTSRNGST